MWARIKVIRGGIIDGGRTYVLWTEVIVPLPGNDDPLPSSRSKSDFPLAIPRHRRSRKIFIC